MGKYSTMTPGQPPSFGAFLAFSMGMTPAQGNGGLAPAPAGQAFCGHTLVMDHLQRADKRAGECDQALHKLQKLYRRAREGDLQCFLLLYYSTTRLVSWLNEVCAAQPDVHAMLASYSTSWPAHFPYNPGSVKAVRERLLRSSLGFFLRALDMPRISTDLQGVALILILYIHLLRTGLFEEKANAWVKKAMALAKLNASTWPSWWGQAQLFLLKDYPDLTKLDAAEIPKIQARTRCKTVQSTNTEILATIGKWFRDLAPAVGKLPEKRLKSQA
jgi:hypothetical protein